MNERMGLSLATYGVSLIALLVGGCVTGADQPPANNAGAASSGGYVLTDAGGTDTVELPDGSTPSSSSGGSSGSSGAQDVSGSSGGARPRTS